MDNQINRQEFENILYERANALADVILANRNARNAFEIAEAVKKVKEATFWGLASSTGEKATPKNTEEYTPEPDVD